MRLQQSLDLALTSALAFVALLAVFLLPDGAPLRIVLAAPLVLLAPGYALAAVALYRSPPGGTERLVLGLGLSLALAACGGLLLNVTPWGLSSTSWTVLLASVSVVASLAAAYLRAVDVNTPTRLAQPASRRFGVRMLDVGLLVGAALIAVTALRFSSSPPPQLLNQAYAVLWAVPDQQTASTIHLGVQSMETSQVDYVLRITQADQTLQEYTIHLEPTQTWETDVQLSPGSIQPGADLHADLFRADSPFTPYRQAVIRPLS